MRHEDHEKVSAEDIELFESLLVDYYGKPYLESYQLLRDKIEARFRAKDTNIKYLALLRADLEDLIVTVTFRLMSINGKLRAQKGERINDVELMANKIVDFVYQEELRRIRKRLNEQPLDDNSSESKTRQLSQPIEDEIETIRNEIIKKCYDACVEELPSRIKAVFRSYYPTAYLDPEELTAARRRLANEVAGMTPAQAQSQTSQQKTRTLNNLQSKVNKWRKSNIEECVRKCVAAQESRHPRLNYLSQQ